MSFPTSLDSFATHAGSERMDVVDHASMHNDVADAAEHVETKIGTGASTPTLGKVLTGTGDGASAWEDPAAASGSAGGVLAGTYPNPTFAADMATQAELDAHAAASDPHPVYTTAAELVAYAQPLDSDLTAIALLSTTNFGRALLTLADAAAGRTALALIIGTDVEAHDTDLTTFAGLTPTNDDFVQRKGGAWANRTVAQVLVDLAAAGTTFQPLDSDLTAIAALSTTSFGRALLALADAAALRTAAGLGTVATLTSDTDGTLAANSDTKVATQKAVKTYVDTSVVGLLDFKGSIDASASPNYPAASKGDAYATSVAGKVGGASGKSVDVGDVVVASADNAGGSEASVGTSWFVLEHNLTGALVAANNLSDLLSASTARTNLGLAALAVLATVGTAQIDNDAVTYAKIQNVSATDKLLGRSTAGSGDVEEIALTAAGRALIDDASAAVQRATLGLVTGNAFREAQEMWPSTTNGCSALSTTEMATNKQNIRALSFADAATQYAETIVELDGWDGGTFTVTVYTLWNSAFFNTKWQVEARSYGNQEAADQAWGTAVTVLAGQAGAAAYAIVQATTGAVTPSGTPALNELVQLRIARLGADAADDLSIAALLYGIRINYTKS